MSTRRPTPTPTPPDPPNATHGPSPRGQRGLRGLVRLPSLHGLHGLHGLGSLHRRRDACGSISIWMATASFIMIVVVGMAVDLGGKVHTQQQARNVAAQAARTGAQQVQASTAIRGGLPQASITNAKTAASGYLAQAGVEGTVTVRGGDTIVVQVSDTYDSKFLSIINLDRMRVTGEASARMIRTEGGVEQ